MGLLTNLERQGANRLPWPWLFQWIEAVSAWLDGANPAMSQASWFVDSVNGNDNNDGASATTALKTDVERQRRMGPYPTWSLAEYHLRYLNDLPSTDPVILNGSLGSTTMIYVHGNAGTTAQPSGSGKAVLATLAIDALTALNHATNTALLITSNALVTSWTVDGLLNQRIRMTSGANTGGVLWPIADLGAKQARCNEPQVVQTFTNPYNAANATFAPALNSTFVVESLVSIPLIFNLDGVSNGTATSQSIVCDSLKIAQLGMVGNIGASFFACDMAQGVALGTIRQLQIWGCRIEPNASIAAQGFRCTNCYSDDTAAGTSTLRAYFNGQLDRFVNQQRNGTRFAADTSSTANTAVWTITSIGIFNNTGGPGYELGGCFLNSTCDVWGVCQAGGTPIRLKSGAALMYSAAVPGVASYFLVDVTLAPAASWISYNRAGASQTTAPAFDPATSTFTAYRTLTPANVQATIGGGGFNGQFFDPLSGCQLRAT